MEFIINYWAVIVAAIAILTVAGAAIRHYFGLPSTEQMDKIREWLVWAVTSAEKELGGGTGKLKLRRVYDLFVTRFPWLAKSVSFEVFSLLVDDALEDMRKMLENNMAVRAIVNGEDTQND